MAPAGEVCIVSRTFLRPSMNGVIHLNPFDLRLLSIDYIQKGLLFCFPDDGDGDDFQAIVDRLRWSFSATLDHFYPLSGRLVTIHHLDADKPSLSVHIDCAAGDGAEFIVASATTVTVAEVRDSRCIPEVVLEFFPLDGAVGYDGHSLPLIAAQVTELADGVFVACSLNHVAGDGFSFWHFFNSWSEIARTRRSKEISVPLSVDRYIDPSSPPPPIHLPFSSSSSFILRPVYPPVKECFFHFPGESIASLKAKANSQVNSPLTIISSLQALLAHTWLAATRAWGLSADEDVNYMVLVGCRSRLQPPLPKGYLGNAVMTPVATSTAGELLSGGLGTAAALINAAVRSVGPGDPARWLAAWRERPEMLYTRGWKKGKLATGSSPRFDMYGNDFGWGRPAAVRSGRGNKTEGKVTVYPGKEEGSMALEVCMGPPVMEAMLRDVDFMEAVGQP